MKYTKAIMFGWQSSKNKMFRGQNYKNAFTLNFSDIDIGGFGGNSESDMKLWREKGLKLRQGKYM